MSFPPKPSPPKWLIERLKDVPPVEGRPAVVWIVQPYVAGDHSPPVLGAVTVPDLIRWLTDEQRTDPTTLDEQMRRRGATGYVRTERPDGTVDVQWEFTREEPPAWMERP